MAYLAVGPDLPDPVGGSDAADACWHVVKDVLAEREGALAFDHDEILRAGIERVRSKLEYTPLAASFCPEPFTVAELRAVYETVWGAPLYPRNFHRKVTGSDGLLVATDVTTTRNGGRPAQLYRRGPARVLMPPFLRGQA